MREALENLKALAMLARELYAQVRSVDRRSGSAARLRGSLKCLVAGSISVTVAPRPNGANGALFVQLITGAE